MNKQNFNAFEEESLEEDISYFNKIDTNVISSFNTKQRPKSSSFKQKLKDISNSFYKMTNTSSIIDIKKTDNSPKDFKQFFNIDTNELYTDEEILIDREIKEQFEEINNNFINVFKSRLSCYYTVSDLFGGLFFDLTLIHDKNKFLENYKALKNETCAVRGGMLEDLVSSHYFSSDFYPILKTNNFCFKFTNNCFKISNIFVTCDGDVHWQFILSDYPEHYCESLHYCASDLRLGVYYNILIGRTSIRSVEFSIKSLTLILGPFKPGTY